MRLTKVQLWALAFVAGVLPAAASADGWFSRAGEKKEVTLTDLLKNPREYMDVEVEFKVYFDATGRNYNPYFTRFNEEVWGNFSAWPIDARLYEKRDFPRPYPFFFASKLTKAWKKVKDVDHLRVIEITGVVRDIFKGQPWIEVLSWSGSSGGLDEDDIKDVIHGDANFVAGNYKDAARLYRRADSSRLPDAVRADLLRRLGDAYFHGGEYDDARGAYERGLRYAPDNPVLKQGAEASGVAYERARAERRGQAADGEMPVVAPQQQPVVEQNGVDEVIRLLEDPDAVAKDVEAWRLELERRAAALQSPEATPVAGSEPVEEPVEEQPAPAPEPAVEEEPVAPAEGCAEEVPEGCAEPSGCAEPAEGCAEPTTEGSTEEVPEGCAEPAPEGCAEEPAEEPVPPAEESTEPEPAEAMPVETPAPVEEPVATPEQPEVEGCAEPTEEPMEGEGACGEVVPEGGEVLAPGCGEQACGVEMPVDEPVVWQGEERVVWVSGQLLRLPRLPFFGAEDVTDDDLRGIIEEVILNPESDE